MKYPHLIALLSLLSWAGTVAAEPESGVYVFPQAAIAQYSNTSDLETDPLIGLGIVIVSQGLSPLSWIF